MRKRVYLCFVLSLALVAFQPGAGDAVVDNVTLLVDDTTLEPRQYVQLRGVIDPGRRGELVEIEVKDCGQPSFRGVAGTTTEQGGEWAYVIRPDISTTIRATWKGQRSNEIGVQQRASVYLFPRSGGRFEVGVVGKVPFWRKRVTLQRRSGGAWKTVRQILLTEQRAEVPGTVFTGRVVTSARFRARFPRGTPLRAILPISQARPCYLAGVSDTERA
jgi:hypothetical protein